MCTIYKGTGHTDKERTVKATALAAALDDGGESGESRKELELSSGAARNSAASSRKVRKTKEGQYWLDEHWIGDTGSMRHCVY